MDDEEEPEDEEAPLWRELLTTAFATVTGFRMAFEWWPRDNWQHWLVYPLTLALAVVLFETARDLLRRLQARRNTPTIQPLDRKGLPPSH